MHSTLVRNHGCTSRATDPLLNGVEQYDTTYIEKTVYEVASTDDSLGHAVKEALDVIEQAYKLYGLEAISLSFNGGKDCTVLLHLVVAVLSKLGYGRNELLRTVFVTCPNPFPHVDAFVHICTKRYNLDCVSIPGPMRQALQQYLDTTQPRPKAIFVGIRRNDPYAERLTHFDMTDDGWPEVMRVHPIVDWTYKDIWDFLIKLGIPYCSLYDEGYTSLGSMENTHPNPDLEQQKGEYKPAFMLKNELHERCGLMSMATSQRHKLVLAVISIMVIISVSFSFRHSSFTDTPPHDSLALGPASHQSKVSVGQGHTSFDLKALDATACKNVDIAWLASDRQFWDGWSTKAMFLQQDGNFTTTNVLTTEGVSLCVVVLLGPSPATSVIRAENHLGPADSIAIEAIGNTTIIPIELQQHRKQTNAYFASVHFSQPDSYILKGRVEYRSYFWEQPIYHSYRPTTFKSVNMAMVQPLYKLAQPSCNARNPDHLEGNWMNKTAFQTAYPLDFYGMFGPVQEDHAEFDRLFVPHQCRMEYISYGQATRCLEDKTIHVWADANLRRNLKAFESANRWCNENKTAECICNDDNEDSKHTLYPWVVDPMTPLVINKTWHGNTEIYYNPVDSIATKDWKKTIKTQAAKLSAKPADIVILGFGNGDLPLTRVSPKDFAFAFEELLQYVTTEVYPHQTIVVRSPQYFCCGTLGSTSWNIGRSAAFARVVRHIVSQQATDRVLLWDVYKLGIEENTCVVDGSTYSRKNVVNVENILLWNLICPSRKSSPA